MNRLTQQKNKGFTLLETLIAIAILGVSLGAAFGVAQKALKASAVAKDQTTAFFLASEGLELVREVRDNVAIYNNLPTTSIQIDWLKPFHDRCNDFTVCVYDIDPASAGLTITSGNLTTPTSISNCNGTSCVLNISNTPTFYTSGSAGGGGASRFSRAIQISESKMNDVNGVSEKEAVVTVTVSWSNQTFILTETLRNWNQISPN